VGWVLRGDEAVRIQGLGDAAFAERAAEYDQMGRLLREAVSRGNFTAVEVESALVARGITVPRKDTEDYRRGLRCGLALRCPPRQHPVCAQDDRHHGREEVFHSFRHSSKNACRAGIPEEVHDALTGHSGGGVGRTYGGLSYPLKPLADAMRTLRYPGLDLTGVKKAELVGGEPGRRC
jgi:hypothetical protein